jgi:hypothetical protein
MAFWNVNDLVVQKGLGELEKHTVKEIRSYYCADVGRVA